MKPSRIISMLGVASLAFGAFAEYHEEIDGIQWNYYIDAEKGIATVGGTTTFEEPEALVIPSTLGGYPVTAINAYAFSGRSALKTIAIPASVTSIEASAFAGCESLQTVELPQGLTKIGPYAFQGAGLVSAVVPDAVTDVGEYAFAACSDLVSVKLPTGLTNIGEGLFTTCGSLTAVDIPSGVTNIAESAFSYDAALAAVTIPSGVENIGRSAFFGCEKLAAVVIPAKVKKVSDMTFQGCKALKTVAIPSGVTSIGSYAFYECSGLSSVTLPSSVSDIGEGAFYGCSGLSSVTIPSAVTSVGPDTFNDCQALKSITLPEQLREIGCRAFRGCRNLTEVQIPATVSSIGNEAFAACSSVSRFTVADSNSSYCSKNCMLCSKDGKILVVGVGGDVVIPGGVVEIGAYAFDGRGIKTVKLTQSVSAIEYAAFGNCRELRSFEVESGNPTFTVNQGMLYTKDGKTLVAGVNGAVEIPSGVTEIGECAFYGLDVTSLKFPSGLKKIGGYSFVGCPRLPSLVIPSGVTDIGNAAFMECSGLKSVAIPSTVAYIGPSVFSHCASLESLTLSEGLVKIYDDAFSHCESLKTVVLPSSVKTVARAAFNSCTALEHVRLSSRLESIGDLAFLACGKLKSVTIPASVATLGSYAFGYCTSLVSVTFASGFASIGSSFSGCDSLEWVSIPRSVTKIENSAFKDCPKFYTLYVDDGDGDRVLNMLERSGRAVRVSGVCVYAILPRGTEPRNEADDPVPVSPDPVSPDPINPGPTPSGDAEIRVVTAADVTAGATIAKAATCVGVWLDGDGKVAGSLELKLAKANKKTGLSKVTGSVTMLGGKKVTLKAAEKNGYQFGDGPQFVTLVGKDISLTVKLGADASGAVVFTGTGGADGVITSAPLGGAMAKSAGLAAYIDPSFTLGVEGEILSHDGVSFIPDGEPITLNGAKWTFAKAASIKFAKAKGSTDKTKVLQGYDDPNKPNVSGLKLSYTAKKGSFKGSFKVYALQGEAGKEKLKKFTVNVNGVVVEGKGFGKATCKKPAAGPFCFDVR